MIRRVMLASFVILLAQCKSEKPASEASSTATLTNTYWRLTEMNGEPIQTPAGVREVHIILTHTDQEDRIKGFAGCNNLGGSFKLDGQKITFSAFSTKMMCPPEQMKVEDFLLNALTATDNFEIKGEKLTLLEGQTTVANFESVYLK
ncbi:META domain-containing protein [Chryseolinea sp. T2]|uniref:META domain-containing protein n=1 Tax=Chryseolinea sp. T2 TaxID=3129255 RepID=UPI003076A254